MRFLQLINIGSQYQYGNDDHAEFLCVVSRYECHLFFVLNLKYLLIIIMKYAQFRVGGPHL